jgi:uncharacterized protein YutE (UPF0331/DUF86 family)
MTNETILNKKISIERCIVQVEKYYALPSETPFHKNYLLQDAIAMNLQRMGELAIDIANYLIKKKKLGLPQDSADAFVLLQRAGLISEELMNHMKGMVGFRNVVVHEYQKLDLNIMVNVIEHHLYEPLELANQALRIME